MEPVARDSDWIDLTDALLRGTAHALSNRAGALSALRDLGTLDEDGRELFTGEIARLTRLIHLLRLVPAEPGALPEALDVAAIASDAVAVLALHPDSRELLWDARVDGVPQPVRAERWVLLRCVLLMCAGALAGCIARGARRLRITTSGDEETTVVSLADGDEQPTTWKEPSPYARELATRLGGALSWRGAALELRMPTLAVARAHEARRRAGDR